MLDVFAATLSDNLPKFTISQPNIDGIFNVIYTIVGALAVVFIIVGGIRYMLAGGEASKVAQAKNTILYALIGLVITIMAFAITNFIISNVVVTSFDAFRDSIVNTLFLIAGAIAVIMILLGAFRYVTANGNAATITKAKQTIVGAVIGLVVTILAFGIVNFVIGSL